MFLSPFVKVLHLEIHEHVKVSHNLEQSKRRAVEESQEVLRNYEEKEIQVFELAKKW